MVFSCMRRPLDGSTGLASVIAVLVVLTVCTNLRLTGAPVGVGEAGLLAVMTCVFLFRRRTLLATGRRFRPVVAFFGAYLLIVLLAGVLSYMHHRLSTAAAHDVFAFVFASFVGFMVLVLASGDRLMAGALVKALPVSALMATLLAFASHAVTRAIAITARVERWAKAGTGVVFLVIGVYYMRLYTFSPASF